MTQHIDADTSNDHGSDPEGDDAGTIGKPGPSRRRLITIGTLMVFIAWLGWASWTVYVAGSHAATGRDILIELGVVDPLAADLQEVSDQIDTAELELRIADRKMQQVQVRPFSVLPVIGRQLESGESLVDASLELTEALRPIFELANAVQADGAQDLDRMAFLASMSVLLTELDQTMASIDFGPDHHLLGSLAESRLDGVTALEQLQTLTSQAIIGVDGLESMLGGGEYLLLIGSPAEMQAVEGMPLSVGTLVTRDGDLRLQSIRAAGDYFPIQNSPPSEDAVSELWGFLKPANDFRKLPITPRFEEYVGPAGLRMWQAATGQDLDGVFYLDPIVLEAVLRVIGDIEVEGDRFGADNVVDYLLFDQYVAFSDADDDERLARKDRLAGIAGAAFEGLSNRPWDPVLLLRELVSAAAGRHIQAYSTVDVEQALWRQVGVAGEINGDEMMVGLMNVGGNKLDPYLNVDVVVDPVLIDDRLELRVSMRIINRATAELPGYVIGLWERNGSLEAGGYSGRVVVFAPDSTTAIEFEPGMDFDAYGRDGVLALASSRVYVAPGTHVNFDFTILMEPGRSEVVVLPSARLPAANWRWGDTTFQDSEPRVMPLPTP